MMYKHVIRPILFRFNPETAHNMTMSALTMMDRIPFASAIVRMLYKKKTPTLAREVFGINFPNPVGLAGGLDKNGEHYNDLANFGFGFVEIGRKSTIMPLETVSVFSAMETALSSLETVTDQATSI